MAWQEHRQQSKTKVDLAETAKTTDDGSHAPVRTEQCNTPAEQDIVNIYDEAMARSESAKESQMRNSAVEYIHPFTPNNI